MQAGIGGNTLAEAADRLSEHELQVWSLYIKKRGGLHVGMRMEWEGAKLRALIYNMMSGRNAATKGVEDFMTHIDEIDEPEAVEIPDFKTAMRTLGFTVKG